MAEETQNADLQAAEPKGEGMAALGALSGDAPASTDAVHRQSVGLWLPGFPVVYPAAGVWCPARFRRVRRCTPGLLLPVRSCWLHAGRRTCAGRDPYAELRIRLIIPSQFLSGVDSEGSSIHVALRLYLHGIKLLSVIARPER